MKAWLRRWLGVVPPAQDAIIGNFNLTSALAGGSGRSIQFAGYVYKDETQEQLQYRLDVIRSVIDRERIISEIPELEAKREQMIKGMEQAREILTDLETRQQKGEVLSSQERMNVKNMRINIAKVLEEVQKGEVAIQEAKRKVA